MKLKQTCVAAFWLALIGSASAATCDVEIEGNDAMKFNKSSIEVPESCKEFTVKLKHTGKLPKAAMGHNWVLTTSADEAGVVKDGMAAGAAKNYVKDGDTRVIAHTSLIGGGESTSVSVNTSKLKAGQSYAYFCSFPGHATLMKGTLKLVK
jgi:azurin